MQNNNKNTHTNETFGHSYNDCISFVSENNIELVQMDCVDGKTKNGPTILTLSFVYSRFLLAFWLPQKSSECVIQLLNQLETICGSDLFSLYFGAILTDNSHEFKDLVGMESSINGGKRTRIFYCNYFRPGQKGLCENNNKLVRRIIPIGTRLNNYTQSDMLILVNNINSYTRKILNGKSAFMVAKESLPEEFFRVLGLEEVPPETIILKPSLLRK